MSGRVRRSRHTLRRSRLPDVSLGVILAVASASIFGPLSGWLAVQRRRNVALWGVFGVILGPIAAGLLMSAPPGRCAACRRPVAGWERRCVACGADVQTGLADVPIGVADTPDEDRTAAE